MPTTTARYGHAKGSGQDDRQQLTSIAVLIAADPRLKPTTAIRSLGVDDPVVSRRLRTKFRADEPRLMAQARRARRANGIARTPIICTKVKNKVPAEQATKTNELQSASAGDTRPATASPWQVTSTAMFNAWCDIGFLVARAAIEKQSVVTQQVLELPPMTMALRGQLALNSIAVAIYTRSMRRDRRPNKLH